MGRPKGSINKLNEENEPIKLETNINDYKGEKSTENKTPVDYEDDLGKKDIKRLEDFNGIGPKGAEKLRDLGYTVLGLATARPDEVGSQMKVSYSVAKGWCMQASEAVLTKMTMKSSIDFDKEKKAKQLFIHTGSNDFNMMIAGTSDFAKERGGGIPTMSITGLTGRLSSGKTQIVFDAIVDCIGRLKESAVFIETEPDCQPLGNIILSSKGLQPIEEVFSTYGKDGTLRETKQILENYKGKIYSIKARGIPLQKFTPNHPIYVKRGSEVIGFIPASEVKYGDYLLIPYNKEPTTKSIYDLSEYTSTYKNTVKIEKDCIIVRNSKIKRFINVEDDDIQFLLGWYLAEGSSSLSAINFALSSKEVEIAKRLLEILAKIGINGNWRYRFGGISVTAYSRILAKFLKSIFSGYAYTKSIPEPLLYSKNEYWFECYVNGDGWSKRLYKGIKRSVKTASPILAGQLYYFLINRKKIASSITIYKPHKRIIKGKIANFKTSYCLQWTKDSKTHWYVCDKIGLWIRVRKVYSEDYEGVIVATESNIDHTYNVPFVTHNTFHLDRLKEIAKYKNLECDWSKLFICESSQIPTAKAQFLQYKVVQRALEGGEKIRLVVVDSFNAKFRAGWSITQMLPIRSREIAEHMNLMEYLAAKYNLAWLITCQAIAPPRPDQGLAMKVKFVDNYYPVGGDTLLHSVNNWVALMQIKGDLYKAALFDSSHVKKGACEFMLMGRGIGDGVK